MTINDPELNVRIVKLPALAYRQAQGGASRKGNFILIVPLDPAYPALAGQGTCRSSIERKA